MVKTGTVWSGLIVCKDSTGALATPSVGPAGVLYVDGTANGAGVTISGANPYKWTVTLPALTAGQCVSMYITATIATIATASVVAEDVADTVRLSDVPAVNVTTWKGTAVPNLSDGYIPALLPSSSGQGLALDKLATMLETMDEGGDEEYNRFRDVALEQAPAVGGLTAQETRDAMKLEPTAGDPAAGSVDAHLDAIQLVTDTLDVSAVTQVAASSAGHLTITAGLTFDEGVTGLTIPADWTAALWTLKRSAGQADTAAVIQLRVSNPADGDDGLQRLLGAAVAAPITAASGTLTVTQATGRIDVFLTDELTALLSKATGLGWDVKFIDDAGDSVGRRGTADVVLTETKAVV